MELSSWFGLVNTLAHALMFIITKTAFSNRALIKTWYYLDRLLLFNGQCSCQKDRRINILGFCVRWREGLLVSRAMKRFQGTNTECSPCQVVERRNNLGFTPFLLHFYCMLYLLSLFLHRRALTSWTERQSPLLIVGEGKDLGFDPFFLFVLLPLSFSGSISSHGAEKTSRASAHVR